MQDCRVADVENDFGSTFNLTLVSRVVWMIHEVAEFGSKVDGHAIMLCFLGVRQVVIEIELEYVAPACDKTQPPFSAGGEVAVDCEGAVADCEVLKARIANPFNLRFNYRLLNVGFD